MSPSRETHPLTLEPRYLFLPPGAKRPSFCVVSFGNSGIKINIHEASNVHLNFTPDFQDKPVEGNSDEAVQRRVKYARMFAAGMIELIKFRKNLIQTAVQDTFKSVIDDISDLDNLQFHTNETMLLFAQKMIGQRYFVLDKELTDHSKNTAKAVFKLKDFIDDLENNPGLLANLKKFAESEKLREIKSRQP